METTLKVEGMHCEACVERVKRGLEGEAGVDEARVSLEAGEARVRHDDRIDADRLREAVERAGYGASAAEKD